MDAVVNKALTLVSESDNLLSSLLPSIHFCLFPPSFSSSCFHSRGTEAFRDYNVKTEKMFRVKRRDVVPGSLFDDLLYREAHDMNSLP